MASTSTNMSISFEKSIIGLRRYAKHWQPADLIHFSFIFVGLLCSRIRQYSKHTDLVRCDDRHLSRPAEEHRRSPERHHEERDVPPERKVDVRAIFTCADRETINRRQLQIKQASISFARHF